MTSIVEGRPTDLKGCLAKLDAKEDEMAKMRRNKEGKEQEKGNEGKRKRVRKGRKEKEEDVQRKINI